MDRQQRSMRNNGSEIMGRKGLHQYTSDGYPYDNVLMFSWLYHDLKYLMNNVKWTFLRRNAFRTFLAAFLWDFHVIYI